MFRKGNSAIQRAVPAGAALGEGPTWDACAATLIWVDIDRGRVHRFDPRTGRDVATDYGRPVGLAVPRVSGGLVLGFGSAFAVLERAASEPRVIAELPTVGVPARVNDGRCDSAGRLWAGTMGLGAEPGAGTLYRLDPDHGLHAMLDGVTISNGLDWSPDDRFMYYVDSATGRIDRFDFDVRRGTITNRRPFAAIPQGDGEPDGLTVDAEGHVWVAVWGGGAVRRYAPDGMPAAEIRLPVSLVTSCAFGGDDLTDLYVTSARYDLSDDELARQPDAGSLFRVSPGVTGRLPHRFGG